MHKISVLNTEPYMRRHSHGTHQKDMFVNHETVSHDITGLDDIIGTEKYLAEKDYGIHGMTDLEGHMAWARGMGNALFYQAGGVNERSVGCENVSWIPVLVQNKTLTHEQAFRMWMARTKQLHANALLLAAWHNADRAHHPLIRSNGNSPGFCSHWDVSQHFPASEGHTDCWPHDKGGYFPLSYVLHMAIHLADLGYEF